MTDPNGGVWKRSYDGVGNLTSVTSPRGGRTAYAYDAEGRLTGQTDPSGASTKLGYDVVGRLVKAEDGDGVTTRYAYDVMDRVIRVTDGLGKHTDYAYDPDGNIITVTAREGGVSLYTYDAAGRVLSTTTPMGETTAFTYDASGALVAVADPLGRTTTTSYTPTGLVASTTDPGGATTTYSYDAAGRRTGVTDPNGHTTTFGFDRDGRETSRSDATDAVTTYGYDLAGRQIATTSPNGNATVYGYDPAGQLVTVVEGYKKGVKASPSVNVATSYGYDADGNRVSVTDPNGHVTKYTVDAVGRITSEANPVGNTTRTTYTAGGRTASTVAGTGATTAYRYDKRGDPIRQDAAGAVATYEYDAAQRLIAVTDPGGVSGFVYDKDGRTTTQIDQKGGRLKTAYDKAGQTAAVTLPTGQQLTYTYDEAGKPTSQSSPWGSLTYAWDAAGNLTRQTRSTGVSTGYQYDAVDRVTAIAHITPQPASPAAAIPTPTSAPYAKGDAAATSCDSVAGYLGSRASAKSDAPLCEHADGYLAGRTVPGAADPVPVGGTLTYQYGYDADGNVTDASRAVSDRPNLLGTDNSPQATGLKPKVTKSAVSYVYDSLDRLTASTTSAGEKNAYGYDPAGNRTSWVRSGAADGDFSQAASFTEADQVSRTETSGSGRGVAAGVATYGYDGAGNRTDQSVGGVSTRYGYNPAGQTTEVAREGRTTEYGYDGLGRNTTSTDTTRYGSSTTRTVFDGMNPAQTTGDAGTATLVRDALGNLVEHVTESGEATWDLLDRLGSTVAGAQGGTITELSSYEDWGGQRFESTGWSAPESFTGERSDPTQGLNHYANRVLDTGTASWTGQDSWRGTSTQPQSLHRYGYVWNNPTSNLDIDGNLCGRVNPASDALPTGCGAPPVQAYDNVTNKTKPPVAPQPPHPKKNPPSPEAKGPNSQNDVTDSHGCKPGTKWQDSPYASGKCVSDKALQDQAKSWEKFFDVLGWIGAAAGLVSLIPGFQWLAPIALIASAASTIYNCVTGGSRIVGCIIGIILTAIPGAGHAAARVFKKELEEWVVQAVAQASKALGISGDAFGVVQGW